jgi:integrase/recombinase XerD
MREVSRGGRRRTRVSQVEKRLVFAGFDRWCWEEKGWTANTATLYGREARRAENWLVENRHRSLWSANKNDLKAFRSDAVKPSAIRYNQVMYALRGFLDYLIDSGYRTTNPAWELERIDEPKNKRTGLPEDLVEVLWAEAKASGPRVATLFGLMWWMGLRKTEARTLEWAHIDGQQIHVNGKGRGRKEGAGKRRTLPIHPELAAVLKAWRRECPSPRWVFPSPRRGKNQPISSTWVVKTIRELGEQAGINLHPHKLRHSIAVHLKDKGADIFALRDFLGHEHLNTTQVYMDDLEEPARIREAVFRAGFK